VRASARTLLVHNRGTEQRGGAMKHSELIAAVIVLAMAVFVAMLAAAGL
jgi:hypothetical protein